jgi:uncharacterized protein YcaQ
MAVTTGTETISIEVARRYLLGRQGLWPGRRWAGMAGTEAAIRAIETLQLDAVAIVARSHDLVLHSRVDGYDPAMLAALVYGERRFFEYGAHLDVYPIEELPFWGPHMRRRREDDRYRDLVAAHPALLDEVRTIVRERGPVGNRELAGGACVASYRGRKDTALGLFHLWLTGELMTHGRAGFERRYDLRERVAPAAHDRVADEDEALAFFGGKALRALGLARVGDWAGEVGYALHRRIDRAEATARLAALTAPGAATSIAIEGVKGDWYLPGNDVTLLKVLAEGSVPAAWAPLGATTRDEVILLSPLDNLLRRERTRLIFGFDYVWEIYKPAEKRRWGAFTMPILYDDRLVARLDPKLDRRAGVLAIGGFWPEADAPLDDPGFRAALARGIERFVAIHSAGRVEIGPGADLLAALLSG